MTTVADRAATLRGDNARLAEATVRWLETRERPDDLFADDVFADLSLPLWRLQAEGTDEVFGLREASHPYPGTVTVSGLDRTSRGFLLAFEEHWDAEGQYWYCREMMHCLVSDGRISGLSVYCTGDWDESLQGRHADEVRLIRP